MELYRQPEGEGGEGGGSYMEMCREPKGGGG
jgi:hypothetical protein